MNLKKAVQAFFMLASILIGLVVTQQTASAAMSITVNTTTDAITDDGQCSLREAIIAANTDTATGGCPSGSGADTIIFDSSLPDPAVFILSRVGANEDNAETGDLDLVGILTIQGTNADQIIIDGNGTDRVFDIRPGATVIISGLTIRNGNPGSGANGGGILVTGGTPRAKLTLMMSTILNNNATSGGGIQNLGNGATATIENTRIGLNVATVGGGGISNTGILAVINSTLDQNQARTGGGIDHSGFTMNLTNVTISNNSASDDGGGVYNRSDATLLNATLNANSANGTDTGGNIFNDTASIAIKNSIIANSNADGNCYNSEGFITSQGYNLESANTCAFNGTGDLVNTDPLIDVLQYNGGYTFTHALQIGSLAIDGGETSGCPQTDQRGFARPVDGDANGTAACDIGAYEFEGTPPTATNTPTVTLTTQPSETSTPTSTPSVEPTNTPTSTPVTPPTPIPPASPCSGFALVLALISFLIWFRPR